MTMTDRGAFDQAEYDRRFHGDFMYDATLEDEEGASARSPLFIILTALVLTAFGVARRGFFKGDLFVAAAVLTRNRLEGARLNQRRWPSMSAVSSGW